MPIAFPPYDRGAEWAQPSGIAKRPAVVDVTNLDAVGVEFRSDMLDPGVPIDFETAGRAVNLRNLGVTFEAPDLRGIKPWSVPLPEDGVWFPQTDWAASNRAIVGVSRDSTGAALASCRVELFGTGSDQIIAETVSDAGGNFTFGNPGTGPFYIVAYKTGSPDVAGTTVNTLFPSAA
jgi:hypothetical protein